MHVSNSNKTGRTRLLIFPWYAWALGLLFLGGTLGCSKISNPGPTVPTSALCYLTVMNLAPYGSPAQIYLSGVGYTQIFPIGSFSTAYISYPAGNYTVQFKSSTADSLLSSLPTTQFDSLGYYTVILYNDSSRGTDQIAVITDNFTSVNPALDSAYYRFFNMAPDMPAVDLYINNVKVQGNRTPADNISNAYFNTFQPIATGYSTFVCKQAGTNTVIGTGSLFTTLQPGAAFTVLLTETTGTSGNQFTPYLLEATQ